MLTLIGLFFLAFPLVGVFYLWTGYAESKTVTETNKGSDDESISIGRLIGLSIILCLLSVVGGGLLYTEWFDGEADKGYATRRTKSPDFAAMLNDPEKMRAYAEHTALEEQAEANTVTISVHLQGEQSVKAEVIDVLNQFTEQKITKFDQTAIANEEINSLVFQKLQRYSSQHQRVSAPNHHQPNSNQAMVSVNYTIEASQDPVTGIPELATVVSLNDEESIQETIIGLQLAYEMEITLPGESPKSINGTLTPYYDGYAFENIYYPYNAVIKILAEQLALTVLSEVHVNATPAVLDPK